MSAADIEAGRSFVTLYVRDRAFRTQMAENEQIYKASMSGPDTAPEAGKQQLDQLEDQIQGYELLEQTAGQSMSALLQDTGELAEQTERLNDALEAVMANYGDLAGMQEEGITLSAGGGGHGGGHGSDEGWLDTGQIEHTAESGAIGAVGKEIGQKGLTIGKNIASKLADSLSGKIQEGAEDAIGSLGDKAKSAGQKLLTGPTDSLASQMEASMKLPKLPNVFAEGEVNEGLRSTAKSAYKSSMPNMGNIAAATKGADIVMAEAVPAMKSAEVVMAEIVPAAGAATSATAGLTAGLAAMGPAAAIAAAAAVVLVPVLAAIDNETGGTLSESGYYPEWLKKIGDAMGAFGIVGPWIHLVVEEFKILWSVVSGAYEVLSNVAAIVLGPVKLAFSVLSTIISTAIKVAFFPLQAVLFALNAPFRAFHLIVDSVKAGFALAHAAVVKFVEGVKALPGLAASCAASMGRLAVSTAETVKHLASSAWDTAMGAINGLGSALQTTGKWMAIAGGSMAAIGAMVVGPLTKAAETFAHHGKEVHEIAEKYEISAEAAATYAYAASQTGKSVKELTKALDEDSDEFAKWNKEAFAAGWTVGESTDSATALCAAYREMKDVLHGLWVQLGRAVAPAIAESTRLFSGAVRIAVDWVRQHQGLITTAFKVASTIAAVGTALATAGGILVSVGAVLSPFTVALAGIAAGLAVVEYKTKAGATVWGSYKDSLFNVFGMAMSWIKPAIAEVTKVVDGIKNAIMAGKVSLAFDIIVNEIKAVWAGGLAWLANKTGGIFDDILGNLGASKWKAAADGAMGALTAAFWRANQVIDDVWENIKSVGATVWSGLQDGFDVALTAIENGWVRMLDGMKDWGAKFLGWMVANVMAPIASTMTELGMSSGQDAIAGLLKVQQGLMDSRREGKSVKEQTEANDEAGLKRRTKRHGEEQEAQNDRDEAAVGRWSDRRDATKAAEQPGQGSGRALSRSDAAAARELTADWQKDVDTMWDNAAKKAERMNTMENNPTVYGAEKQAAAAREWEEAHRRATEEDKKLTAFKADIKERTGSVGAASNEEADAIAARDAALAAAAKAKSELDAGKPGEIEDPEKKKKLGSAFTTTSAYAFGQFNLSGDPVRAHLEETKKMRKEAADERKQRDADWKELLALERQYGTRDPDELQAVLWGMNS